MPWPAPQLLAAQVVADTRNAYRVLETSHPPTYYLPREDVAPGALAPAAGNSTMCEWKGRASYWDVTAGGQAARRRWVCSLTGFG